MCFVQAQAVLLGETRDLVIKTLCTRTVGLEILIAYLEVEKV